MPKQNDLLAVVFQGFGHEWDKLIEAERCRKNKEGENGELKRKQRKKEKRGRKETMAREGDKERKTESERERQSQRGRQSHTHRGERSRQR